MSKNICSQEKSKNNQLYGDPYTGETGYYDDWYRLDEYGEEFNAVDRGFVFPILGSARLGEDENHIN